MARTVKARGTNFLKLTLKKFSPLKLYFQNHCYILLTCNRADGPAGLCSAGWLPCKKAPGSTTPGRQGVGSLNQDKFCGS